MLNPLEYTLKLKQILILNGAFNMAYIYTYTLIAIVQ